MIRRAGSLAAAKGESGGQDPRRRDVAKNLRAAWRLAYLVVGDVDLATRALAKAYHGPPLAAPTSIARLDLMANTLRISLTRAAAGVPGLGSGSEVISAMWRLPPEQRAALWLVEVDRLDDAGLAAVLGLTTANAKHVAGRAIEWLDVALDRHSGPLCPLEASLNAFVRNRLPDREADDFEDHLPRCPTCRTRVRAHDELADLADVLDAAIPEPPSWLNVESLEARALPELEGGPPTLVEPSRRTPAVRPLAACCVALIVVALIGIKVVGSEKASADPSAPTDPRSAPVGSASSSPGGATTATTTLPPTTATTIVVTTTSLPILTFPTITTPPPSRRRRR